MIIQWIISYERHQKHNPRGKGGGSADFSSNSACNPAQPPAQVSVSMWAWHKGHGSVLFLSHFWLSCASWSMNSSASKVMLEYEDLCFVVTRPPLQTPYFLWHSTGAKWTPWWNCEGWYGVYKMASSKRASEGDFGHMVFILRGDLGWACLENLDLNFENKTGLNFEDIWVH